MNRHRPDRPVFRIPAEQIGTTRVIASPTPIDPFGKPMRPSSAVESYLRELDIKRAVAEGIAKGKAEFEQKLRLEQMMAEFKRRNPNLCDD